MVLVESQAEPYHFVEREVRKTLEWAREWFISLLNVVTDIVGCLSFTFLLPNSFSLCLNDAPPVTARTIFNAFPNLRRKRRNVWRFHSIFQFPVFFALRPFLSDFPRFSYQRPKHDYDLCWERKMKSRVSKYWILSNTNCDRATMRLYMMGVRWLSDTRYRTRTVLTSQ